jgi:cation diffusion facilitator CzcD-associated flavoprotein CzcO
MPTLQRAYRAAIYWQLEWRAAGFVLEPRILKLAEHHARRYLATSIPDPALRAALTPDYRLGCKRILLSNDYYPALLRPNVELVTEGIAAVTPRGVRTRDGVEREVDAILFGTGFSATQYLAPLHITGTAGRELNALWRDKPEAYLGITVAGFPNLFLLMGPNTGLGHNSMVFMIEAQARYALQCLQLLRAQGLRTLDVRPAVQAAFNATLRARLQRTVWASGCNSWYQTDDGRNPVLWPGFTVDYWLRTRRVELADYTLRA